MPKEAREGTIVENLSQRAAAFLAVASYPEIHFQSSKVEKGRDRDTLRVSGTLTIKDRSRAILLDVTQVDRSA